MNERDSESGAHDLVKNGYELVKKKKNADVVLLNKVDLLKTKDLRDEALALVRRCAPDADVLLSSFCEVPVHRILAVDAVEAEREGTGRKLSRHERVSQIEYVLPLAVRNRDPNMRRHMRKRHGNERHREEHHNHNHLHHHDKSPFGSTSFVAQRPLRMDRFQSLVHSLRSRAASSTRPPAAA